MPDLSGIEWLLLLAAVFAVAFFYSSVGHGGATGYLAVLALLGVAPDAGKVAVLIANVLVAAVAWRRFYRAAHFNWPIFIALSVTAMPCAFLGSRCPIQPWVYKSVLGGVLCVAGMVLLFRANPSEERELKKCPLPVASGIGAGLGFLAGLTGIGGGVFLSPLLYLFRWVKPKSTAGVAAGFIVVNSMAGLLGSGWGKITQAGLLLWLTIPSVLGALLGTYWGARRWSNATFSRVLAAVILFAGGKLLLEVAAG